MAIRPKNDDNARMLVRARAWVAGKSFCRYRWEVTKVGTHLYRKSDGYVYAVILATDTFPNPANWEAVRYSEVLVEGSLEYCKLAVERHANNVRI